MSSFTILSWNVNGVRSQLKKNFLSWIQKTSPDILCLQETKARPDQLPDELIHLDKYHTFWNWAEKPGYSGVAIFSKQKPIHTSKGYGVERFDSEGRVLETDFGNFTLLNIYFPNGKMNQDRLNYKMDFYEQSLKYFNQLRKKGKKLVICGDYNTAHKAIDLKHPKENEGVSGFLAIERAWMDRLVENGYIDTLRCFNQNPDQYSWWDLRTRSRERNVGWRIDYHFVSEDLKKNLKNAWIMPEVMGSDHCPVGVQLEF